MRFNKATQEHGLEQVHGQYITFIDVIDHERGKTSQLNQTAGQGLTVGYGLKGATPPR